jgi:hypothetical protein
MASELLNGAASFLASQILTRPEGQVGPRLHSQQCPGYGPRDRGDTDPTRRQDRRAVAAVDRGRHHRLADLQRCADTG